MPPSRQNEINPCRRPAKPDGGAAQSSPAAESEFLSWAISLASYCVTAARQLCGSRCSLCRLHQLAFGGASAGDFSGGLWGTRYANGDPGHDKSAHVRGTLRTKLLPTRRFAGCAKSAGRRRPKSECEFDGRRETYCWCACGRESAYESRQA